MSFNVISTCYIFPQACPIHFAGVAAAATTVLSIPDWTPGKTSHQMGEAGNEHLVRGTKITAACGADVFVVTKKGEATLDISLAADRIQGTGVFSQVQLEPTQSKKGPITFGKLVTLPDYYLVPSRSGNADFEFIWSAPAAAVGDPRTALQGLNMREIAKRHAPTPVENASGKPKRPQFVRLEDGVVRPPNRAEEKLLRAIFGDRALDPRDYTSTGDFRNSDWSEGGSAYHAYLVLERSADDIIAMITHLKEIIPEILDALRSIAPESKMNFGAGMTIKDGELTLLEIIEGTNRIWMHDLNALDRATTDRLVEFMKTFRFPK